MIYQWLLDHTDSLVAAANFTAVIFLLLLCVVTFLLLRRDTISPESDLRIILWGVIVESFALALHRTYWGSWRLAREYGYEDWNQWFVTHGYLAVISSFMVLAGLAMILSPLWRVVASPINSGRKRLDYYIPAGLILGVYILLWTWIEDENKIHGDKPGSILPPVIINRDKDEGRSSIEAPHVTRRRIDPATCRQGESPYSLGIECYPPIPERQRHYKSG